MDILTAFEMMMNGSKNGNIPNLYIRVEHGKLTIVDESGTNKSEDHFVSIERIPTNLALYQLRNWFNMKVAAYC